MVEFPSNARTQPAEDSNKNVGKITRYIELLSEKKIPRVRRHVFVNFPVTSIHT